MKLMINFKIRLAGIILILFFPSCTEKDELTLPVNVDFMISISDNSSGDEYLSFTGGLIGVQKIVFEGKRDAGGDIFFETDPKMNLSQLAFGTSVQPASISDFDIPQGIFNYMKWDINLKEIFMDELNDDDEDEDEDDSPKTGLAISGTYSYQSGASIPIIIAIDVAEHFSVRSFDPDGNSTIVLSVDKDYDAILLLDPWYAFHSISRESIEEADTSDDSGTEIILISSEENEDLYEVLLYRIAQSAKVIVK